MSEPFVGQIQPFGFNFAPRGWAQCNGQLLPISGNDVLFALLGTIYGGDGRTTFGLPDLRGRAAVHAGTGPGLSSYSVGQMGGTEAVTLGTAHLPSHSHGLRARAANADQISAKGNVLATSREDTYSPGAPDTNMASSAIQSTGGGQAHTNLQPYLTLNWCIALVGIFPSRS